MKVLVIVIHPNLAESRINRRLAEAVSALENVTCRDLYSEFGNLSMIDAFPMQLERETVLQNDRIVFQHPIYWYSAPALLKKWVEDVLTDDWAFGPHGTKLKGKEWMHCVSCAGPLSSYTPGGFNGFSVSEFLRPYQQIAKLCGMHFCPTFAVHDVYNLTDQELDEYSRMYAKTITDVNIHHLEQYK